MLLDVLSTTTLAPPPADVTTPVTCPATASPDDADALWWFAANWLPSCRFWQLSVLLPPPHVPVTSPTEMPPPCGDAPSPTNADTPLNESASPVDASLDS